MKNMKVSMKLVVSFMIVIALAIIIAAIGAIGMYRMNAADDDLYNGNYLPTVLAGDISQAVVEERVFIRNFIIYDSRANAADFKAAESSLEESKQKTKQLLEEYKGTIINPEDKAAYDEFIQVYNNEWLPVLDQMHTLGAANKTEEAKSALTASSAVAAKMNELSTKLQAVNLADGEAAVNANTKLFTTMLIVEIAVLVAAIVISMLLVFYLSGLIGKPLSLMAKALEQIGTKGDLALDAEMQKSAGECITWKDEIGTCARAVVGLLGHLSLVEEELQRVADGDLTVEVKKLSERDNIGISVTKMVENLNKMFGEINASTSQVSTGSKQVADGAQALAQGSTEQAAAVQQLSSSISEVAEKTKENAEMALRAANLANTIKNNAEKGSVQMDQMTEAVREINQASQSISKVIKVIDDIAFQTNILALNAAVEAARAGQHGKGFAVVAEEVRNLAAKSAEAAKDTGGLIANSMEKAELGARIADETSASLVEIVSGINESTTIVSDIAHSSEEQSVSISQINKGIDQVAQVVQQNSATAEQSAAASQEMSGQADMLEQLISQFKLREGRMKDWSLPSATKPANMQIGASDDAGRGAFTGGDYGKY